MYGSVSTRANNLLAIDIINQEAERQANELAGPTAFESTVAQFKAYIGDSFVPPEGAAVVGEVERRVADSAIKVVEATRAILVDLLTNFSVNISAVKEFADLQAAHSALVDEYEAKVEAYSQRIALDNAEQVGFAN